METPKNILRAIAGESMARNKYTYFASAAKKEGFEQISAIFTETADNEKEHAKRLMKLLKGGETSTLENYDFPTVGTTSENLAAAAAGEKYEWGTMYPEFAETAQKEGFAEAQMVFEELAKVEAEHEKRYLKLKMNVDNRMVFKKDVKVYWKCRNCGLVVEGTEAPIDCPACAHPQAYYEVLAENY
ncbi:MAG: rubrerythrin family protein [Candidatus Saccharibacteria bacterium]|nr:rubrerythrin family protein [Candidatus Saccharibacteria bacterium]